MDFKSLLNKLDVIGSKKNLNEGWDDMMKASKEKEKEKGTGKFDKKETSTGTVYTRKSSTFDDGGDDKDTKKAKEKAKKAKVKEGEEKVDEDDVEEGNEFSGARDAAVKAGKKEFTVGGKTYPVKESKKPDDDNDGVPNWADKKPGEDDNADKKKSKKKVAEAEEEKCDDCDKPVDDCECDDHDHEDKDEDDKKKVDESLQECYDQAMAQEPESGMNISSNMDTKTGNQSLTVTAQGAAADELAQLLKLSGVLGSRGREEEVEMSMEESGYANEPNTQMQSMDAQFQQGNDLNRRKGTYPKVAGGDNPLQRTIAAMEAKAQADVEALEKKLMEQLESLKVVTKKK
jgi:hypothetical protein